MKCLTFIKWIVTGLCVSIALNNITIASANLDVNDINMDKISDYAETVSYMTGDLLCYVFTYYKEGEAPSLRMRTAPIPHDPFLEDGKYKLGVFEWSFIHRNTFQSAFLTEHEHDYFYFSLHSHYVKNLIKDDDFKKAIYRCARTKNLNFEDLFERITNNILFVDGKATVLGRATQGTILATIAGFVLQGAFKLTGFLVRITGLSRLGIAGTSLAFVHQKDDSAYYQIWKTHQERIQQAEAHTQNLEGAVRFVTQMDPEQAFWYHRWQKYNLLIHNVQHATSADTQTDLINLYFIDYWILQRWLDALRDERMEDNEANESVEELNLNMLVEMFDMRKKELDRQLENPHPTKRDIVAGLLLDQSEKDPYFKCDFQDKSSFLCRMHFLLFAQSRNTIKPQQVQELRTLENQFANEVFN